MTTETKTKTTKKTGKPTGAKVEKTTVKGRQTVKRANKDNSKKTTTKVRKFANDNVIRLQVKENPRRPNSKEFERFSLFENGQTVAKNLEAQKEKGFRRRRAAIRKAAERGEIAIEAA